MKTVAEVLQEARLEKGKTLQEISDEIKIRASYLLALEENNYKAFLSEAQLKGFLVNYANNLGIETNKILALYRRERITKDEKHSPKFLKEKKGIVFTPRMIIGPAIAILVIAVIGFFVYQYYQTAKPPQLEVTQPKDGYVAQTNKIVVSGVAEVGSTIRVNNKEISSIDNNGHFETTVTLEKGSTKIFVEAENGFKKKTTQVINVSYDPDAGITPTPTPVGPKITLVLQPATNRNVTYSVSVDNGPTTSKLLSSQSSDQYTASKKIVISGITSSDVDFIVNGVSINVPKGQKSVTLEWNDSTNSIKQF